MKLITKAIERKLIANHPDQTGNVKPPLKLFAPWGAATWLIASIDPDEPSMAFGLCDLGFGCPELGYVWLPELRDLRSTFGLKIERDLHFKPAKTLTEYADEARANGRIAA